MNGTPAGNAPDPASAVYRERAHLVAHLAAVYPSWLGVDEAEPEWPVVYVDTPEGQLSWHIAPGDLGLFAHVQRDDGAVWDGHTTAEKYARLDRHTRALAAQKES